MVFHSGMSRLQLHSLSAPATDQIDAFIADDEWYLDHNQIVDLTPLANLTGLQYLDFADNQISEISVLARLSNLRSIDWRV